MLKLTIWISTLCVISSLARPQNNIQPQDDSSKIQTKDIHISKFHVNTSIQMRYGIHFIIYVTAVEGLGTV
jgi:hypothetical protein